MPELNESTFDATVSQNPLAVIDFFATWCGPCKMLAPILSEVEKATPDVAFYRIDVDGAPDLARRFGIMSIPTLVFLKNGVEVDRSVGLMRKPELLAKLDALRA